MTRDPEPLRRRLLSWYRGSRRDLPWRRTDDPYRIWVSEIMLQQTTVATAAPYWERFVAKYPSVQALAAAPLDEVLVAWAGLGYYGRAKRLHQAAREIVAAGGRLPRRADEWRRLPGVGEYTAAAVASIAHGEPVAALDGNIVRVLSRLVRLESDPTRGEGKKRLARLAQALVDPEEPGSFNQALMEVGARVCRPVAPLCSECPLTGHCEAREVGDQERFPLRRARRSPVAVLRGAFWIEDARGRVLLRKLPAGEANAGLWEPPGATAHHSERDAGAAPPALAGGELARRAAERLHGATGLAVDPGRRLGRVQHAITHHRITVHLFAARSRGGVADTLEWRWAEPTRADGLALTSAGARMMRLGAVAQSDAAGS